MTPTDREFFNKASGMPQTMPSEMRQAEPQSASWFSIGLNFGFGFLCAGLLFSILLSVAWVLFLGALFMGTHR